MTGEDKTAPSIKLEKPPEGLIEVNENEDPVRIKIDRKFYKQLENTAEKLGTTRARALFLISSVSFNSLSSTKNLGR